jgi:hypothetical protein
MKEVIVCVGNGQFMQEKETIVLQVVGRRPAIHIQRRASAVVHTFLHPGVRAEPILALSFA